MMQAKKNLSSILLFDLLKKDEINYFSPYYFFLADGLFEAF